MSYANLGQAALDYFPCRYGNSKLLFRGPRRRLQGDYVTFLGGIETYGKFVVTPFPTEIEIATGLRAVNLGCVNAGVDAYLTDSSLIDICSRSKVTVIQVMGAQNMSNRFYAVHPRRNDRFLRASSLLKTIYRDVDFTEFNFTRHMLMALARKSPERFAMVEQELKDAWVARMQHLIELIGGKVVLLWLADHAAETESGGVSDNDPLFVDRGMVRALGGTVAGIAEIVATRDEIVAGQEELVFGDTDRPATDGVLGPVVHRRVAETLAPMLSKLV